ncbi:MAG: transglycosylase SLT domain-containing protein [Vicinamibacterales bacterium]
MSRLALWTALVSVALLSPLPLSAQDGSRATAPLPTPDEVKAMIVGEAVAQGIVPPELALAVAGAQSGFDPDALGRSGARGVMQVRPAASRYEFGIAPDDLWDASLNIEVGIMYLARLHQRHGGDWRVVLAHYTTGSAGIDEPLPSQARSEIDRVMRLWAEYARDRSVRALVVKATEAEAVSTAPDAVTGGATHRSLLDDMTQARLSFRRALRGSMEQGKPARRGRR